MTDLDRLDALAAAATPGPWRAEDDSLFIPSRLPKSNRVRWDNRIYSDFAEADAAFIVALVNAYRAGELVPVRERDELRAAAEQDWHDLMLDALCESDNGNNPFYRDDDDTVSLAMELATVIRAALHPETTETGS